jgi:autotransporter-associated beta strand protein
VVIAMAEGAWDRHSLLGAMTISAVLRASKRTHHLPQIALVCLWASLLGLAERVSAIDASVPFVNGGLSSPLGDGTGVVIGIVDSGVDVLHPALAGTDSLGRPRHVGSANFVTTEPGNLGDDVDGHGTWVASAALSSDPRYAGLAPDAMFVNARVLNNNGSFSSASQVVDGIGFAITLGSDILNLSLNYNLNNSNGDSMLDLVTDWAVYERGIHVAACAGNIPPWPFGSTRVRSPGSAFNGISVARTDAEFGRVHPDAAQSFTANGRMKPDLVAPGTSLTLANNHWEGAASDWVSGLSGCSFATPHVAGLIAQQIEYGRALGLSTHPLVVKTTMMNAARKDVLDKNGSVWQHASSHTTDGIFTVNQPLDDQAGAGQITSQGLLAQYGAGQYSPGVVPSVGWDLRTVTGVSHIDYLFGGHLQEGSVFTATLSWLRAVTRIDDGDGAINSQDAFFQSGALDNLDIQLLANGNVVAQSVSKVDNVEHLVWSIPMTTSYTLRVSRLDVENSGPDELFGLAWNSVFVPEPSSITINVDSGTQTQEQAGHPTLSGTIPVIKTGLGTVVFDAANTYTGPTSIEQGTLAITSTSAVASTSLINLSSEAVLDVSGLEGAYTVSAGQTIAGSGTILGSVTFGAGSTLSPGLSIATADGAMLASADLVTAPQAIVVPEPATLGLGGMGIGFLGLGALRRKRA